VSQRSVLKQAMDDARQTIGTIPYGSSHEVMVECIRTTNRILREGRSARWSEEDQRTLKGAYEEAKRERDAAEQRFEEAQKAMMRAWYDMRDAMDAETDE
jgi:hypothetical protein